MTPNLGATFLFYLKHQYLQKRDPISCGGAITVLANALHLDLGNLQPLLGEWRVGFPTINACGMVRKRQGRYFIHVLGVGRIYSAPLPNNLFSIEEGRLHYDVHVEQDQWHNQEPEDGDEVKELGGGPKQETQPQNPYTTYEDVYTLEGTIDNLYNLSISLCETTPDMTLSFHWPNHWHYQPPQRSTRWSCKSLSLVMPPLSHKFGEFYLCNNEFVLQFFVSSGTLMLEKCLQFAIYFPSFLVCFC
jgi:hypothetical protein